MITQEGDCLQYLLDYKDGKIKDGLKIGCDLDEYIRFKPNQLNIILGHDNVGKTYWINWYFLTLALKHDLKFCIWSGENKKATILRDLLQMYYGIRFKDLTYQQINSGITILEQQFKFISNKNLYKPNELLKLFEESECNVALIDPFTGLDRQMDFQSNYNFLNSCRDFCNKFGVTIYINTHPNSESGRTGNIYQEGEYKGHLKAPLKDHIEGGKAFSNRCDDLFVIHRLVKHETMKYVTWVNVEKVKDMDTGGKHTALNDPIMFDFNSGLGFKVNGVDPLQNVRPKMSNSFPAKQLPLIEPDIVNGKELLSFSEKMKQSKGDVPF
jgi:hypothetical protein